MAKNINNEAGFGSLETILLVFIVLVLGFVGWYVYNSSNKANSTINSSAQSLNDAQSVNLQSTKTTPAAGIRAKEAATYLLSFSRSQAKLPLSDYISKHITDGEFMENFKSQVDSGTALVSTNGLNPVYCGNSTAPTGFTVASSKLNGDNATVVLSPVFVDKTTPAQVPQVLLSYSNSEWSVNGYSCISNPPAQ